MRRVLMGVVAMVLAMGLAGPAAADDDPAMFTWGSNRFGQLGNQSVVGKSLVPVVVTAGALAGKRVTSVTGGGLHTCALAESKAYCWGRNVEGQLGNGESGADVQSAVPVAVVGLPEPVTTISAGDLHTCALAAGAMYCWGEGEAGQVGDGALTFRPLPTLVDTSGVLKNKTITSIDAGVAHTCAVADGAPYCWGGNFFGQVGNGTTGLQVPLPVAVDVAPFGGQPVTTIRAGRFHTCALAGGKAFCGGANTFGQLGDDTTDPKSVPVAVKMTGALDGKSFTAVRTGGNHTCALTDGKPYCWGDNFLGQLGSATPDDSDVPVPVVTSGALAGKAITALTLGNAFSCVVADGQPICWGYNFSGELGRGSAEASSQVPLAVVTSGVLAGTVARTISGGSDHAVYVAAQVPTVPRGVVASAGPGAVTVSWEVPKDDGGRAISGYRVSTAGGSCETAGLSCTVSGLTPGQAYTLNVVARNAIGDSAVGSVLATPGTVPVVDPPEIIKVKQTFAVPKKLKKRGVTVIAAKGAKTSAGVPVTTTVKTRGKVKVIRKGGAVKIRGLGAKKWRVTVTQTAPGSETAEPLRQRVVYVNGKRR